MSLGFYAWGGPKYIFIILFSIIINYGFGLAIGDKGIRKPRFRKLFLTLGVIANLSLLFYFKYLDFSITLLDRIGFSIPLQNITLPIGISFFTFQGMSYIIDLYRGEVGVQKKLLNIMLYISLFPQLIAGPIVRYRDINEQIDSRTVNLEKFSCGIRRFSVGLAKKVIIANSLGSVTDQIFQMDPQSNMPVVLWIGVLCYAFQIYFDFSGYSDMAIGLGKMLGFDFLENFNYPYLSKSITEFWRRWHISLSSWFRDYLYIPMGGSRKGNVYLHLAIVFLVTGLWHGAATTFVAWGIWHGFFIVLERVQMKHKPDLKIPSLVRWIITLLIVLVGWVIFRAPGMRYALEYLGVMFGIIHSANVGFTPGFFLTMQAIIVLVIAAVASTPILKKIEGRIANANVKLVLSNVGALVLFAFSIVLVVTSTYNPFIYFRF